MGAGIVKNSTVFGNLTWEANRWLTLGFEMTHKDTRYLPTGRDNKGMTYMGMVQFSF
jgi:hypothetical protein